MKKKKTKLPVKAIFISLLCLATVFSLFYFPFRYLSNSDYFKIKDSVYFSGQNIFKIDLESQTRRLRRIYPDYKAIVLRRQLPDGIIVDFIPRQARALLRLSENFYVDSEGIIFLPLHSRIDSRELPVIIGLNERIPSPRSGAKYNESSLKAILEFLNSINNDAELSLMLKITKINLFDPNDIFLFTDSGCKINLGSTGSLEKDLSTIQMLMEDIRPNMSDIEYIDLRFREPVVKYK
ncbi:MAG: cell division protein FtsQ/DivIB [Candidatus Omnitrophica bacterium]|nr:cell division protein FtsQ/DivIB [Candidatus Omnitrophota bacterium]